MPLLFNTFVVTRASRCVDQNVGEYFPGQVVPVHDWSHGTSGHETRLCLVQSWPDAQRVLHVEDLLERPVEVVGNVRDLLEETIGRVRHDPPDGSPAMSTVNSVEQCGQVTAAWL